MIYSLAEVLNITALLAALALLVFLPLIESHSNPVCPKPTLLTVAKGYKTSMVEEMFDEDTFKTTKAPPKMKYSTKFMMDLYQILTQEAEKGTNRPKRYSYYHSRLRDDEIAKAAMSDDVVSMICVNKKGDVLDQKQKLVFDMSEVPYEFKVLGAELKLYQKAVHKLQGLFVLSVYRRFRRFSKKESKKLKKVAEKISSTSFTGWLSIDVTRTYRTWLKNRTNTETLYVTAQLQDLQEEEIHPASLGVMFQSYHQENDPFLVAYLQAADDLYSRMPRYILPPQSKMPTFEEILANKDKCELHSLKVSFKELGWHDWVIAPEMYTTAYCKGTCDFPIVQGATNHALVQSLMELKFPDRFPKPSCAPAETSHLSVLFKRVFTTILKNFKGMIVQSCKCQ